MKRITIKTVSLLLTLLLLSASSVFAFASDAPAASGACGENLTWTLDSEGTLTISGTGDMDLWMADFTGNDAIVRIVAEPGVTGISDFSGCENLVSASLPDGLLTIGDGAFSDCERLASINLPDSLKQVGTGILTNTAIYRDETQWTDGLLYVDHCLLKAKSDIAGSVVIRDNTVVIAGLAFYNCAGMTDITMPGSVVGIGRSAFADCASLNEIDLGGHLCSIGKDAFLRTGAYNNEANRKNGVLYIDGYCIETQKTVAGSVSVVGGTSGIADYAFDNCDEITSVTIPDSVSFIGKGAFNDCGKLRQVTLPSGITAIESKCFNCCEKLVSAAIPDGVERIGDAAFFGCRSLTEASIPESVRVIGEAAFGSTGIHKVSIPSSVEVLGRCCFGYDGITDVTDGYTEYGRGPEDFTIVCEKDSPAYHYAIENQLKTEEPASQNGSDNAEQLSSIAQFFKRIADFFKKIAEFFRNLFSK